MTDQKQRSMDLAIQETHQRLEISETATLPQILDAVVEFDTRLGNVAASPCDMRQVVARTGRHAWYVVDALHRASRPGTNRVVQHQNSPILLSNVRATGKQCWARFRLGDAQLVALANPSPHVTGTTTITSAYADRQTWRAPDAAGTPARIKWVLAVMIALAEDLPGRYVSFNNDGAGNSLNQFHVSVNRRPDGIDEWPIEHGIEIQARRGRVGTLVLGLHRDYPVPTMVVSGAAAHVLPTLAAAISDWDTQPDRTGNILVWSTVDRVLTALFWPRMRRWRRAPGFRSGEIAFMELAGCFVISNRADFAAVDCGRYDYRHFWRVLRGVADRRSYEFAEAQENRATSRATG